MSIEFEYKKHAVRGRRNDIHLMPIYIATLANILIGFFSRFLFRFPFFSFHQFSITFMN